MNRRRITIRKSSPVSSYQKNHLFTDLNQENFHEKQNDPKHYLLRLDQVQFQNKFIPYTKKIHSANGWFQDKKQHNYYSENKHPFTGQEYPQNFIDNIQNFPDFQDEKHQKQQNQHKRIIKTPIRNTFNIRNLKNEEKKQSWNNSMIPKLKDILKKLESPQKQNKNQVKNEKLKQNFLIENIKKRNIYKVADVIMGSTSFVPNESNYFVNSHQPKRFLKTASCKKRSDILKVAESPSNFQSVKLFKNTQKVTKKRQTFYNSKILLKNSQGLNKNQSLKQMQQMQAIQRQQRRNRTLKNILF